MFPGRLAFSLSLPEGGTLRLGDRPLLMAVLNVTPDSFGDPQPRIRPDAPLDVNEAVRTALAMEADGADLIDIGGESTRPGADPVSVDDELARVLPIIHGLRSQSRVPISIDTYKAEVARAALDAGASMVNDISGLRYDPPLAAVVAERGAPLVLMHMRGTSKSMYAEAEYGDLIREIGDELRQSIDVATNAGVPLEQIVVDPGIGFAKRPSHSYGVLARLAEFSASLRRPVAVGVSRKSFLNAAMGHRPAVERDWGTAAAVAAAVLAGAHIVRVHAVAEMAQVVRVAEEIRRHDCR